MNFYFIIDIKDEENKASLTPSSQTLSKKNKNQKQKQKQR